jgi:hypothetical protein
VFRVTPCVKQSTTQLLFSSKYLEVNDTPLVAGLPLFVYVLKTCVSCYDKFFSQQ